MTTAAAATAAKQAIPALEATTKHAAPSLSPFLNVSTPPLGSVAKSRFPDFLPRTTFPIPSSVPKTYFLGHHNAALRDMKQMLGHIDIIVECRDYRVPLTGRNHLLETELLGPDAHTPTRTFVNRNPYTNRNSPFASKKHIVVFTKWDLGAAHPQDPQALKLNARLREKYSTSHVHFSSQLKYTTAKSARSFQKCAHRLLELFRTHARDNFKLTGHRVLVAGMPNVGKSTLMNALRAVSPLQRTGKGKVAKTGADPGVTRKVGSPIKILDAKHIELPASRPSTSTATDNEELPDGDAEADTSASVPGAREPSAARSEGVYMHDSPGVFLPFVPEPLDMLKLALVGGVKANLIDPLTLADFVLYNINLRGDPSVYTAYTGGQPTNEVSVLLEGVARATGKVKKNIRKEDPTAPVEGGKKGKLQVDWEAAAIWVLTKWRAGLLGRFVLDDWEEDAEREGTVMVSNNQAKKMEKVRRSEAAKAKRAG